jgi:hypothetical protein
MKQLFLLLFFTFSMFSQNHRIIYFKQVGRNSRNNHWFVTYDQNPTKKYPLLIVLDDYLFDPFMALTMDAIGWFTWNHCYWYKSKK